LTSPRAIYYFKYKKGVIMVLDRKLVADEPCDLADLLRNPRQRLTKDQWNNFDRYMRMTNDDKSAADVDIGPGIERYMKMIDEKGAYWW
jgi:hypothetical protein